MLSPLQQNPAQPRGGKSIHPMNCSSCCLVMTSLEPHGLWPARLLFPLDSQARILEGGAISCSRGSSRSRDRTCVSCIGRRILYHLSHLGSPMLCAVPGISPDHPPASPRAHMFFLPLGLGRENISQTVRLEAVLMDKCPRFSPSFNHLPRLSWAGWGQQMYPWQPQPGNSGSGGREAGRTQGWKCPRLKE